MSRIAQMERFGASTARIRYLDGQVIPLRLSEMELLNRSRWEIAADPILRARERNKKEWSDLYAAAGFG